MSLAATATLKNDGMRYEDSPRVSRPTKKGIRIVSEMSNMQIVGYFVKRNGYPISVMINLAFIGFFVWDKVGRIFW